MLQRYLGLLRKDIIVGWRNYYFLVIIAFALVEVLAIQFLIPPDLTIAPDGYYFIEYEGEMRSKLENFATEDELASKKMHEVDSREEVIQGLLDKGNSIGIVIRKGPERPIVEMIFHGYENSSIKRMLEISIRDNLNQFVRTNVDFETVYLGTDVDMKSIPQNKNTLPAFIMSEAVLIGFILISALIFMEKDEGTIRAYNVTPGSVMEYLASKISLMVILSVIYTLIITPLVMGFRVNYLSLLIIAILGSIFSASLAVLVASFFDNLTQSLVWLIIINLLLGIPMMSYFLPSFAPWYITILPTYPLIFALRESIFPTGDTGVILTSVIVLGISSIISYILAVFAYRLNVARD